VSPQAPVACACVGGVFGWPRFSYERQRIVAAQVVPVSLWRTGNCGIIWTPRQGWSFVLRSGPALQLTLNSGKRVTVGVGDPHAALTALGFAAA
jgi:hypothetical protein